MTITRFDDSLPTLVSSLTATLGAEALQRGVVLRDAVGRLSFFAGRDAPIRMGDLAAARQALRAALGVYATPDPDRVVVAPSDLGSANVLDDDGALTVDVDGHLIRLVDRRIVGADWLRPPVAVSEGPPRFVFMSIKGGVGRSTALAVVASHLASRGKRVLVIDLDLEAPGVGPILLEPDAIPPFGVLDALLELNLGPLDDLFISDLVGASALEGQLGRIDVAPAFGRRSLDNPADVLGKLARAYTEQVASDGTVSTLLDKVRTLVARLAPADDYDVVLVDARAGLNESSAASILGLGADVLLFATDERQSFEGYAALLAHLARFVVPGQPRPEWLERLTVVHAKAPVDAGARAGFIDRWRTLVDARVPHEPGRVVPAVAAPATFDNPGWNSEATVDDLVAAEATLLEPLVVLKDDNFAGFDPLTRRDLASEPVYRATFGSLIDWFESALGVR